MKKILGIMFVLFVGIYLTACNNDDKQTSIAEEDLLALSAVGGINDINFNQDLMVSLLSNEALDEEETGEEEETEEEEEETEKEVVENKEHLILMLEIMNENTYSSKKEESDLEDYENLLNIKVGNNNYKFYYNEILIKHEFEEDEDEYEEEKTYQIDGIIIYNDETYEVIGEKNYEIEKENDEIEDELELELKISLNDKNYSIIKYEKETELEDDETEIEKELVFKTYVNDKKVSEMKYDFEKEDQKLKIKLVIKEDNKEYKYTFKDQKDNEIIINYQIQTDDEVLKGQINVKIVKDEDGNIKYEF